jgi:hypothetical protein
MPREARQKYASFFPSPPSCLSPSAMGLCFEKDGAAPRQNLKQKKKTRGKLRFRLWEKVMEKRGWKRGKNLKKMERG